MIFDFNKNSIIQKLDFLVDTVVCVHVFLIVHFLFYPFGNFAPSENPKLFSTAIIISLSLAYQVIRKKLTFVRIQLSVYGLCFFAFFISMVWSTLTSLSPQDSIFGPPEMPTGGLFSYFVLALCILYFVLRWNFVSRKLISALLITSGLVTAVIGIIQHLGIDPIRIWSLDVVLLRSSSTIGNPVPYGIFIGATLLITIANYYSNVVESKEKISKLQNVNSLFFGMLIGVQFVGLWFSGARAPIAICFLLGIFYATFVLIQYVQKSTSTNRNISPVQIFRLLLPVLVCVGTIISFTKISKSDETNRRIQTLPVSTSISSRLQVGMVGIQAALAEHPMTGIGPSLFHYIYGKNKPVSHNRNYGWGETMLRAHNEFAEILVGQGILGFILYIILILLPFWHIFKLLRLQRLCEIDPLQIGFFLVHCSFLANSLFMFHFMPNLLLFYILPVLWLPLKNTNFSVVIRPTLIWTFKAVAVLALLAASFNTSNMFQSDLAYSRAYQAYRSGFTTESFEHLSHAMQLSPENKKYHCLLVFNYAFIGLRNPNLIAQVSNRSAIKKSAETCREANQFSAGGIYELTNNILFLSHLDRTLTEFADSLLKQLLEMAGNDVRVYVGMARRFTQMQQFDRCVDFASQGLKLRPEAVDLYAMKVDCLYQKKDSTGAVVTLSELKQMVLNLYPFLTLTEDYTLLDLIGVLERENDSAGLAILKETIDHMKSKGATFNRPFR